MGHVELVKAITTWLESCRKYLSQKDVAEKLESNVMGGRHQVVMESTCYMLSYLADVFEALKLLSNDTGRAASPVDADISGACAAAHTDLDSDWLESELTGPDDDESQGEESDEDSLCNKLCTFTLTQREFMNQHWYHCHTCKMVDGVGVCTICAKVCHRGHDVTYAKYGSFFCDCGAKEDGSCIALTKRSSNEQDSSYRHLPSGLPLLSSAAVAAAAAGIAEANAALPSSLRRRQTSPERGPADSHSDPSRKMSYNTRHQLLSRQLAAHKNALVTLLATKNVASTVLSLVQYLSPSIATSCKANSSIGSSVRARKAIRELHTQPKRLEMSDTLMLPTLGSQEGAFENVKLTYTGEQVSVSCFASQRNLTAGFLGRSNSSIDHVKRNSTSGNVRAHFRAR